MLWLDRHNVHRWERDCIVGAARLAQAQRGCLSLPRWSIGCASLLLYSVCSRSQTVLLPAETCSEWGCDKGQGQCATKAEGALAAELAGMA